MKALDLPDRPTPRPDPRLLARALAELAVPGRGAVSLPWLDAGRLEALRRSASRLGFRRARPQVGEPGRAVFQDFEIALDVPADSLLCRFTAKLERDFAAALAELEQPPIAAPRLNDVVVQRYAVGSGGISPHRDHARYRDLVVLLSLSGSGRLFLCDDRSGTGAQEVSIAPGRLLLMRAPGFDGCDLRPFHYLAQVTARRYGLGLRHDRTKVREA